MISYQKFRQLYLKDFLSNPEEIEWVEGFEFLDKVWVGEVYGFTEWLRHEQNPEHLGAIAMDLKDLNKDEAERILKILQLPLRYGMNFVDIVKEIGIPINKQVLSEDRETFNFQIGRAEKYYISATIHNEEGLIYLNIVSAEKSL